ncbi:MFS transporter [Legionella londiniensis]|nr:MFS transporter [Legionella londiniensis]
MKLSALLIVLALIFIEWLDFSLYLYLAKPIFSKEFFPESNLGLTLTFAIFAAAYLARPVGGWLFGREADLNGRRKPMVFSALLMGISTLGICILPGYAEIGSLAAWLLLAMRIGQGLALGGEINTSGMFLIEHHPQKPLLAGSLVAASGAAGLFLGGAIAAMLQYAAMTWAWRLLFALVGVISLLVCGLRKQLRESPEFRPASERLTRQLLKRHWRGLVNIAAIGAYVSVMVYLCNVYWLSYAIDSHLWSNVRVAWSGSLAQLASALIALPIACYSNPQSTRRLLQLSMLFLFISAPVLFYTTAIHAEFYVYLALMGYILGNGFICAALFFFLYQQLPVEFRCQGVSTIWALAASLGALFLPVAEHVVKQFHLYWLPGFMVSTVALVTFTIISLNRKQLD